MWGMIAASAFQIGSSILGGNLERKQARVQRKANKNLTAAENLVQKARVAANNQVRDANNELSAATGSLQRFRQSLNNKRALRTSGREQETIQTNLGRALSDATQGKLETRLDTSFELGALTASMAAAGVGGSSRQVLNSTIRMSGARKDAALEQSSDDLTYDALKMLTNTQADAYGQIDNTLIFDQLDLQEDIFMPKFDHTQKPAGNWFTDALGAVARNPQLAQQTIEEVRGSFGSSGSAPKYADGSGWASQVRV